MTGPDLLRRTARRALLGALVVLLCALGLADNGGGARPLAPVAATQTRVAAAPAGAVPFELAGSTWTPDAAPTALALHTAVQGAATVDGVLVIRANEDVSADRKLAGWAHIGDPDARGGYLLDAYQADPDRHAKMFLLTAPGGRQTTYVHRLDAGEMPNNSFAAIAPSGRFFLSGEWRTEYRLLAFPMPHGPGDGFAADELPLASVLNLDRPMRDVQGCAFAGELRLVCATNDPDTDLYPVARQLLEVDLPRPLDGRPETGSVHLIAAVPHDTSCAAPDRPIETEGLDVTDSTLVLTVNQSAPCRAHVLYRYRRQGAGASAPTVA